MSKKIVKLSNLEKSEWKKIKMGDRVFISDIEPLEVLKFYSPSASKENWGIYILEIGVKRKIKLFNGETKIIEDKVPFDTEKDEEYLYYPIEKGHKWYEDWKRQKVWRDKVFIEIEN
jgi:hypothetical protein